MLTARLSSAPSGRSIVKQDLRFLSQVCSCLKCTELLFSGIHSFLVSWNCSSQFFFFNLLFEISVTFLWQMQYIIEHWTLAFEHPFILTNAPYHFQYILFKSETLIQHLTGIWFSKCRTQFSRGPPSKYSHLHLCPTIRPSCNVVILIF
jgi:hypothetical protein